MAILFSSLLHRMVICAVNVKVPSDECHRTLLMISQYWFRHLLGAIRQQAITWANICPNLCCHMASLGHNESFFSKSYFISWCCLLSIWCHVWNWPNTMDISSALRVLMTWYFSARASVATVLSMPACISCCLWVTTLKLRQHGRHFADDIFKFIFW